MPFDARINAALEKALSMGKSEVSPPLLGRALTYAVFPGGARIRPTILLSVAAACGEDLPGLTDTAAAALELIHCASLVHDDLPAFDNADLRRGKASVHRGFGEPLAILAGDSLIVLAFELLARTSPSASSRAVQLMAFWQDGPALRMGSVPVRHGKVSLRPIFKPIIGQKRRLFSLRPRRWAPFPPGVIQSHGKIWAR